MNFPPELLVVIFAHVSTPTDFANLRLVCRVWNEVVKSSHVAPHLLWPKRTHLPNISTLVLLSEWFPRTTTIQFSASLWNNVLTNSCESTATVLNEFTHHFPYLKTLTVLPFHTTQTTATRWLSASPQRPHLNMKNLQCPGQLLMRDTCCKDVATLFPNLTDLNCESWSVDSGVATFRELENLQRLSLCCTLVTNVSLTQFAAGRITQLTHLDLSLCQGVSDMGVYAVILSSPNLVVLSLDYTPNVHGGVTIMALASSCTLLKVLCMRKEPDMCSTVTPPHLIYFAHKCVSLKCVVLSGHPPAASTATIRLLDAYYPNVFLW
jgi:hypothetical protein